MPLLLLRCQQVSPFAAAKRPSSSSNLVVVVNIIILKDGSFFAELSVNGREGIEVFNVILKENTDND